MMKRAMLVISLGFIAAVCIAAACSAAETLVMADSFESDAAGQPPSGWVPNSDGAATVVGADTVSIPDGELAVRLLNSTTANGEIEKNVGEVKKGRLVVWFYQPSSSRENINIEVRNGTDRLIGVFITGSGNVRLRDAGVQSGNIKNLPNDRWHEFVMEWDFDTQIFRVFHIEGGQRIEITSGDGAKFDPQFEGKVPDTIAMNVSKREEPKEAFFDNVQVFSF
jgi:hypothetical protein